MEVLSIVSSIEEKAKRYDEALMRAKNTIEVNQTIPNIVECIESLFPKLKESKNNKIIRVIRGWIYSRPNSFFDNGISKEEFIDWLEKQSEQKSLNDVAKEITKNKETAMSFLKSCGIMNANGELADEYKIDLGEQKPYGQREECSDSEQKPVNLVTILDDYFANTPKEQQDKDWEELKHLNNFGWELTREKHNDKIKPKFKVKYAGSEYNVLEVRDIIGVTFYGIEDEPNHIDYVLPNNCEIVSEQKHTEWNKDDEYYYGIIQYILNNECVGKTDKENAINWFKSLKDRIQSNHTEWSKEDEKIYQSIMDDTVQENQLDDKQINWLKYLKDKYSWNPSDEQMKALDNALSLAKNCGEESAFDLRTLYEQLKKLRKE